MPKRRSMAPVASNANQERAAAKQCTKKTSSNTCPPNEYIKRVTCPVRQQFYKELQEQKQVGAQDQELKYPPRVSSKYSARGYEVRFGAVDTEGRGDGTPEQRLLRGVGESQSAGKSCFKRNSVLLCTKHDSSCPDRNPFNRNKEDEREQTLVDVGVGCDAPYKEASRNSASYNTKEGLNNRLKYGLFSSLRPAGRANPSTNSRIRKAPNLQTKDADKDKKAINKKGLASKPADQPKLPTFEEPKKNTPKLCPSSVMHLDIKPSTYLRPRPSHQLPVFQNKINNRKSRKESTSGQKIATDIFKRDCQFKRTLLGPPLNRKRKKTQNSSLMSFSRMNPSKSILRTVARVRSPSEIQHASKQKSKRHGILTPYIRTRSSQSPTIYVKGRPSKNSMFRMQKLNCTASRMSHAPLSRRLNRGSTRNITSSYTLPQNSNIPSDISYKPSLTSNVSGLKSKKSSLRSRHKSPAILRKVKDSLRHLQDNAPLLPQIPLSYRNQKYIKACEERKILLDSITLAPSHYMPFNKKSVEHKTSQLCCDCNILPQREITSESGRQITSISTQTIICQTGPRRP